MNRLGRALIARLVEKNSIAVSADSPYCGGEFTSQFGARAMHLVLMLLQQSPIDPEQARRIAMTLLAVLPVIILVGYIIFIVPFWFICKKAGFSPWLSLINIIPLGNLILIYILAFGEWKVAPVAPPQFGYPYPPPPPPQS
jgi:hypothetical protein